MKILLYADMYLCVVESKLSNHLGFNGFVQT